MFLNGFLHWLKFTKDNCKDLGLRSYLFCQQRQHLSACASLQLTLLFIFYSKIRVNNKSFKEVPNLFTFHFRKQLNSQGDHKMRGLEV